MCAIALFWPIDGFVPYLPAYFRQSSSQSIFVAQSNCCACVFSSDLTSGFFIHFYPMRNAIVLHSNRAPAYCVHQLKLFIRFGTHRGARISANRTRHFTSSCSDHRYFGVSIRFGWHCVQVFRHRFFSISYWQTFHAVSLEFIEPLSSGLTQPVSSQPWQTKFTEPITDGTRLVAGEENSKMCENFSLLHSYVPSKVPI